MKKFTTLILSLSFIAMYGQDRIPVDLADSQISLSLLRPSFNFEKSINSNQSLYFSLGIETISDFDADSDYEDFGIAPLVSATYRNYYSRKKVKKELRQNSGNYIGLHTSYIFNSIADNRDGSRGPFQEESSLNVGALWGIQRNYMNGVRLGLNIGPGFSTGSNRDLEFSLIGNFELGFVINTKN